MTPALSADGSRASGLLAWLQDPPRDCGVRVAVNRPGGLDWRFVSYHDLAAQARKVAAGLQSAGLATGAVVCLAERASPAFIATFFGALLAGATPSPVALPSVYQADAYRERSENTFATVDPALIAASQDQLDATGELLPARWRERLVTVESLLSGGQAAVPAATPPNTGHPALIQFTSGSSGSPRGLAISHEALAANVAAIADWLALRPGADETCSWLPAHHDMGLVGSILTSVVNGTGLALMQPEQFLRRPLAYLEQFGRGGSTIAVMPSFGLEYLMRRVKPADLAGCDFSGWRTTIVGAERVDADYLDRLTSLLSPFGFARECLTPAYGLAETTLAVTGTAAGAAPMVGSFDPDSLRTGEVARSLPPQQGGQRLTGCGRPLTGISLQVTDDKGVPVPDGMVGEVRVCTPGLASTYRTPAGDRPLNVADGWLCTGDGGFMHEGELYVLGRMADSAKVRGNLVFAEDLEEAVRRAGAPRDRAVVLLGHHAGEQHLVGIFQNPSQAWREQAITVLGAAIPEARLQIACVPSGTISFTTSGKPRRKLMWERYLAGEFDSLMVPV
jgi:acyl-CoA synthetase (AMP-forming)/AMP-acid ligase II